MWGRNARARRGVGVTHSLEAFAIEVGPNDPVTCVGGRTQWDVGGQLTVPAREVSAPAGIVKVEPEEMIATVGAGTPVSELLAALADVGQTVALPVLADATVGGVLAVGQSSVLRLGHGHVRETLLQAKVVMANGEVVTAGGPTVKNVSGFDVCRLLVGSLGTLAFLGEVIVRTKPRPKLTVWLCGTTDPFALHRELFRPAAILWDGVTTWLCLQGHRDDVRAQRPALGVWHECGGPPEIPPYRASYRPGNLAALEVGVPFIAEIGVGTVHTSQPLPARELSSAVLEVQRRMKLNFDPTGRLNPGRVP